MNQRELVNAISKDCLLSNDVVRDVLESLRGVMIEELVTTGKTSLYGVFKVHGAWKRGYTTAIAEVPSQDVLRVKLSRNFREMYKYFGPSTGRSSFITSKNWKDFLKWARENLATQKKKVEPMDSPPDQKLEEQFENLLS